MIKPIKLTLACLTLFFSVFAYPHPHSYIDIKTVFKIEREAIIAVSYTWAFDSVTSAEILHELKGLTPASEAWKKQAAEIMANVIALDYFSEFYHQNKRVKFATFPSNYAIARDKRKLVLTFDIALENPIPIRNGQFELITYDPTFFTDISYKNSADIKIEPAGTQCEATINRANPSSSAKNYAFKLDSDDAPDRGMNLGLLFAQRVNLSCR